MTGGDGLTNIQSIRDLERVKAAYLEAQEQYEHRILVCSGAGCVSSGCALVRDAVKEELEALGLGDVGGKAVAEYSGGMRRRLALARALLAPCDALVLDEPFTGLDPEIRARCWEQVRRYTAGKSVVLASHDPADARALEAEIFRL